MPMNYMKTAMLLAALTALFVALGGLVGGKSGMLIAFLIALGTNGFSLWKSDTMVLRMYGAHEVDEGSAPEFLKARVRPVSAVSTAPALSPCRRWRLTAFRFLEPTTRAAARSAASDEPSRCRPSC